MNYCELRKAIGALTTLDDIGRCIFNSAPYGNRKLEIAFPFGGQNKREMTERQTAIVLRALYDDAATALDGLGVTP